MDENTVIAVIGGSGDRTPSVLAANIVTWALATAAVALRFWSRRLSKAGLGWDDWLILLTAGISQFQFGIGWWWYSIGGGKYMGNITVGRLRTALTIAFIVQVCWAITMFLVRASALALWLRLFTFRWVKHFCWIWRIINILWIIASITVTATECQPSWAVFDPLQGPPGACGDLHTPFLALGISSIILDVAVLVVPLKVCWGLQLSHAMRLILCGMFLTGSFTFIVTIIRIVVQTRTSMDGEAALNVTWAWAELGYWTVAEVNISILSACLPCLRPVMAKIVPSTWTAWSTRKRSSNSKYTHKGTNGIAMSESNRTGSIPKDQTQDPGVGKTLRHVPSSATYIAGADVESGRCHAARNDRIPMTDLERGSRGNQVRELSRNRILVEDEVRVQYE